MPNFIDKGRRIGGLLKGVNALVREDVEVINRIMEHIQIGCAIFAACVLCKLS